MNNHACTYIHWRTDVKHYTALLTMLQYKIIFQLLTSFPNCSENTSYNSTINLIGTSTFIPPVYQLSTAITWSLTYITWLPVIQSCSVSWSNQDGQFKPICLVLIRSVIRDSDWTWVAQLTCSICCHILFHYLFSLSHERSKIQKLSFKKIKVTKRLFRNLIILF